MKLTVLISVELLSNESSVSDDNKKAIWALTIVVVPCPFPFPFPIDPPPEDTGDAVELILMPEPKPGGGPVLATPPPRPGGGIDMWEKR